MTTTHDTGYSSVPLPERDFSEEAYPGLSAGHIVEALIRDKDRLEAENKLFRQLLEKAGIDPRDYFEESGSNAN